MDRLTLRLLLLDQSISLEETPVNSKWTSQLNKRLKLNGPSCSFLGKFKANYGDSQASRKANGGGKLRTVMSHVFILIDSFRALGREQRRYFYRGR